jgi:hypothetical protein
MIDQILHEDGMLSNVAQSSVTNYKPSDFLALMTAQVTLRGTHIIIWISFCC